MPEDRIHHEAFAVAPPDTVWAALQRAATWQGFGMIDEVTDEVVERGRLRSFAWAAVVGGTRHAGTARVAGSDPGCLMALDLETREIAGRLTVDLVPQGEGSVVRVTLHARSRGLTAGLLWGVIRGALQRGLPRQVDEFASGF